MGGKGRMNFHTLQSLVEFIKAEEHLETVDEGNKALVNPTMVTNWTTRLEQTANPEVDGVYRQQAPTVTSVGSVDQSTPPATFEDEESTNIANWEVGDYLTVVAVGLLFVVIALIVVISMKIFITSSDKKRKNGTGIKHSRQNSHLGSIELGGRGPVRTA